MSAPNKKIFTSNCYFILVNPEDKSPGVLCRTMNTINRYITELGGMVMLDSYDPGFTTGKMSFTLDNVPDPDEALCYISSFPEVRFF